MKFAWILLLAASSLAAQSPRRILSTAPSITEMLFALGLGDRVVGVTTYCHYPEAAKSKPKIGTYLEMNYEAVLAAKPDLAVVLKSPLPHLAKLRSLNVPLLEVETEPSLASIRSSIAAIAKAAGVRERGDALNASIDARLQAIRTRAAKLPSRKIVFVVGRNPGQLTGLVVVGASSYLTELIKIAGGENAFADSKRSYLNVSAEHLLARDPDVILDMGDMADTIGVSEEHKARVVTLYSKYPALKAVKQKSVHAIAADYYVVPGPRLVEAADSFFRYLHPEAAR